MNLRSGLIEHTTGCRGRPYNQSAVRTFDINAGSVIGPIQFIANKLSCKNNDPLDR